MSSDKPRRPSRAPEPISPLSGRGSGSLIRTPPATAKVPDWDFWLGIQWVKTWQAVALSLNIEPDSLKQSPHSWIAPGRGPFFIEGSFESAEIKGKFDKRLRLLVDNLTNTDFFSAGAAYSSGPGFSDVKLSEVAAWALSLISPWDIPRELDALAKGAIVARKQADANAPNTWTVEKRAQLRKEHDALKSSKNKSPTKELATKYRVSESFIRRLIAKDNKKPGGSNWEALIQHKKPH